jgi:hypothetical protein
MQSGGGRTDTRLWGPGHSRDGLSSATAAVAEWLGPFAVSIIERREEHEL